MSESSVTSSKQGSKGQRPVHRKNNLPQKLQRLSPASDKKAEQNGFAELGKIEAASASSQFGEMMPIGLNAKLDVNDYEGLKSNHEPSPRADQFSDEDLTELSKKYQLVCMLDAGKSSREALDHLEIKGTESWARKLYKRYKEQGVTGLLDRRMQNGANRRVLTESVKDMTLALWYARPAAGPKAIWEELKKLCAKGMLTCPKYDTVKKFLKAQPPHHKLVREGKIRVWDKQARPIVRFNITSYANERWQVDHTRLDIWVRIKIGNQWLPVEAYLSTAMDAHTRAIAGIWLSTKYPDSWTVALLLRQAILPKSHPDWKNRGIPNIYQCDRGKDFMSDTILLALGYLGISRDPDRPIIPTARAKLKGGFLPLIADV